jgi:hypothetical protein
MPSRFRPGTAAYTKDGRRYVVEEVSAGIVYCLSDSGAETEYPETQLFNEAEWSARAGGNKIDRLYGTIRQSKAFAPYKGRLDRAAVERLLTKAERLVPGILDFTAFAMADRVLREAGQDYGDADLSIVKCRGIFDATPPETRAALLAAFIDSPPDVLVGAGGLGDNLLRAMIAKGTDAGPLSFEDFRARRRR